MPCRRWTIPGPGDPALWSLGSGELDALVVGMAAVVDRLRVRHLDLVTESVRRGRPAAVGATSATVWLAGLLRVDPGCARRTVTDAAVLAAAAADPVTAPIATDARDGLIGVDQAVIAATAVAALPGEFGAPGEFGGPGQLGDSQRAAAVESMRANARTLDPDGLRRAAQHLVELVDPDRADARLAEALERAERRAHATRGLVIGPERDGAVRARFTLPAADAAVVRAALQALAAPHPSTTTTTTDGGTATAASTASTASSRTASTATGGTGGAGTAGSGQTSEVGSAPWPGPDGTLLTTATTLTRDDRTHPQRMADALVGICERTLATGDLPTSGGERPQLVVLVPLDRLTDRAGTGHAGTGPTSTRYAGTGTLLEGTLLSPGQLRRLACDSSVLPAVLGSASQPLDIGRESRTIPTGIRRALAIRDRGCVFPGCDRPPGWTDAHHIHHWADGGETSLANLVLLCGHHHRQLHHRQLHRRDHRDGYQTDRRNWTVSIAPDGHPEWAPPAWMAAPGTVVRPRPDG